MKKFKLDIEYSVCLAVEVEAEDEESAKKMAHDYMTFSGGDLYDWNIEAKEIHASDS